MASFKDMVSDQGSKMAQELAQERVLKLMRKAAIEGIKKATDRVKDLKRQGKLADMDPKLRNAIRELCAEAAPFKMMGGKKTRKRKGKKSKKSYRKKSTAKKTLKRRKKKAGDKLCGPKRVMHHGKCESESVLKMKKMQKTLAIFLTF